MTDNQIAQRLGVSKSYVYVKRKELGLPGYREPRTKKPDKRTYSRHSGLDRLFHSLAKITERQDQRWEAKMLREARIRERAPRRGYTSEAADCFTEEQDEFLRAIIAFRTKHKRIPTLVEGFRIAKSLGWSKPKEGS